MEIRALVRVYPDGTGVAWKAIESDASSLGLEYPPDLQKPDEANDEYLEDEGTDDIQGELFFGDRESSRRGPIKKELKSLTSRAKRTLRCSVIAIESAYPDGHGCFFTGTLPPEAYRNRKKLELQWSEICRLFKEKVVYWLEKSEIRPLVAWKTEFQGNGNLHLHMVLPGRAHYTDDWAIGKELWTKLWSESVIARVPEMGAADWSVSCNCKGLHAEHGDYLAKYLVKDATKEEKYFSYVKSYWGATNELRSWIDEGTEEFDLGSCDFNFDEVKEAIDKEVGGDSSYVVRTAAGRPVCLAWRGGWKSSSTAIATVSLYRDRTVP